MWVQFYADNRRFVCAGQSIHVWHVDANHYVHELYGDRYTVYACTISDSEKFLLSVGIEQPVKLWDLAKGTIMRTFHDNDNTMIETAAFVNEEKWVVTIDIDSWLYICGGSAILTTYIDYPLATISRSVPVRTG